MSGSRDVAGFGRLPRGWASELWLFGGDDFHGARARLFRDGVLIVEDLHVGALIGKKTIWRWFGVLPRYVVATGYGDVRKRDIIEIYAREAADGDPFLAPGYQDLIERREELGRAEVSAVDDGPVGGPVVQATLSEGRLAVGDRVRVMREGRPLAEALRLLSMTDPAGRATDKVFAGGDASLRLGFAGLRPGDTVVAFDVPPAAWTEERARLLEVRAVTYSTSEVAVASAIVDVTSPAKELKPAIGLRARVLRDRVVIADGFTIGYCPEQNVVDRAFSTLVSANNRSGSPVIEIGLDFPDLRVRDQIEVYRVLPAGDH